MTMVFGIPVPDRAVIGLIGEDSAAISAELSRVAPAFWESGGIIVDYALEGRHPLHILQTRRHLADARQRGKTILLASWDESLLRELADEVWWIADGSLRKQGDPGEVLDLWRQHIVARWREMQTGFTQPLDRSGQAGDGRARIDAVDLLDASGTPIIGWRSGEPCAIRVAVTFLERVADPVIGILIRTRAGTSVYGTNTELEKLQLGPRAAGERIRLHFAFRCDLCPGEYTLTVASHDPDGIWHDWLEDVLAFTVGDSRYTAGVANLRARASWEMF